jgi:hypothetical protein
LGGVKVRQVLITKCIDETMQQTGSNPSS